MYKLIKKDGNAKRGEFHTVHGVIQTPVFMNVGTAAAIKGAVSTPSSDGAAVMKAVNDNKNGLYVLVCYTGNAKANEARNIMVKNGVDESRIICLQGGMKAWNN